MVNSKGKVAIILSTVTGGLIGYNYREIMEMKRLGKELVLFVTKFKPGPYMPPVGIPVYTVKILSVLLFQFKCLILNPTTYIRIFFESLATKTIADYLIAQKWATLMKHEGASWIHCHVGDHKLYIGYYCHKLTQIPLSVTLHGYDLYANPNWEMLERSLKACAQIITISDYNRRLLVDKYGDLGKRVKVIRLSADLIINPAKEKSIKHVLIVGGFMPRKGYDILIQALHLLDRKDIHLWIVGYKGPVNVEKLVSDYELHDCVTIFGQVSDEVIKLLYIYCDIFCMPSRFDQYGVGEGLPVSLMEAMSYEKPIVSTYHTGIPELVPDILVQENDFKGLAEAIAKLADDPTLRYEMGKRNRKIIENDYSNLNVKKLIDALILES